MADAVLLFVAALLVLGGGVVTVVVVRTGRRRMARLHQDAPRRLRAGLRATDDYIRKVNEALSEEDLDSLETRKQEP